MEEVDVLIQYLSDAEGKPLDIEMYINTCISNVICSIVLGKHYDHDDKDFVKLITLFHANQEHIVKAIVSELFPFLRILPGDIFKRKLILKNADRFFGLMDSYIQEHKNTFDENNIRDFIDCYINELRHGDRASSNFTGSFNSPS